MLNFPRLRPLASVRTSLSSVLTLALLLFLFSGSSLGATTQQEGVALCPPGKCRFCEGSKKCQDCWPAGSKVNTGGLPCIGCDASGRCNFCGGSGTCYTCDGDGYQTGCPDCSKVLKAN